MCVFNCSQCVQDVNERTTLPTLNIEPFFAALAHSKTQQMCKPLDLPAPILATSVFHGFPYVPSLDGEETRLYPEAHGQNVSGSKRFLAGARGRQS